MEGKIMGEEQKQALYLGATSALGARSGMREEKEKRCPADSERMTSTTDPPRGTISKNTVKGGGT
jgi:hypothetical protein